VSAGSVCVCFVADDEHEVWRALADRMRLIIDPVVNAPPLLADSRERNDHPVG
jgi:hypothetical protein